MTTSLNTTDSNSLNVIAQYLTVIQSFIDQNITNSNNMTSAAIYLALIAEKAFDIDQDSFIKGFRVAVRVGQITGIESAKRAGYRKIGSGTSINSKEKIENIILPYLEDIQKIVDEKIQGNVKMTASAIYQVYNSQHGCDLSEDDFVKAFRLAVKEGDITGLETAYKFGYKRSGFNPLSGSVNTDEIISKASCEIIINERHKIVALDRHNWGYMFQRDSGTWSVNAYFDSTRSMLKSVSRKIIDDEIKGMESFNITELINKIDQAENRIANLLYDLVKEVAKEEEVVEEVVEEPVAAWR
jgi:hypothetical protein